MFVAEAKDFSDQVAVASDLSIRLRHQQTVGPVGPTNNEFTSRDSKPVRELRPPVLQSEGTLGDLKDWKDQFTSYHVSSNLKAMTFVGQQGYLLAQVDKTLSRHLRREISATSPVLPVQGSVSCFDILTQFFAQRNPIHLRRQAFFSASQKEGQSILDYRAHLRALGNEGDLENLTVEGAYCLMYILGARDDLLRRELCRVTNPTLAVFDSIVEAHAQIKASDLHKKQTAHANRIGAQKKSSSSASGSNSRPKLSDDEKKRRKNIKGRCFRCGNKEHMMPQCKLSPSVSCNTCKQTGHISPVCSHAAAARSADTTVPDQLAISYTPDSSAAAFYAPSASNFNMPAPQMPL